MPRETRSIGQPTVRFEMLGERPCCRDHAFERICTFELEPRVELRALGEIKAREQVPAIQVDRSCKLADIGTVPQLHRIAPQCSGRDGDILVAPGIEDIGSESGADEVNRFAERSTSTRLIELRPEEPDQSISPLMASWGCENEISQEANDF